MPWDRPLGIVARNGQRRVLAAVDGRARDRGLAAGMQVAHAQALVHEVMLVPEDPAADRTALKALADWCHRFGPVVAVDAPDGLYLDATGLAHLYGDEAGLLAVLAQRLNALGIAARLAIADTAGAAYAWARFGAGGIVAPQGQQAMLAGLPVAALRLAHATAKRLVQLGLGRIGRLYDMPRAPLARRFGQELVTRLDQALGRVEEPIGPRLPERPVSARLGFAEPIATPDDLARAIAHLTGALCRDMAERGLGARRLVLLFHRVDGVSLPIRIGTVRPSREALHLARLLAEHLDTIDPGFGIEAMALDAERTDPLAPAQIGTAEEAADLGPLIDRLMNRLGRGQVYRLMPVESDWPEHAMRRAPPLGSAPAMAAPVDFPRPVRLLRHPEPVEVLAVLPDDPPSFFIWRGRRHRVLRADGPERLAAEWWRKPEDAGRTRDYFQVEDESGRRFWLFRESLAGAHDAWFLHGFFA